MLHKQAAQAQHCAVVVISRTLSIGILLLSVLIQNYELFPTAIMLKTILLESDIDIVGSRACF